MRWLRGWRLRRAMRRMTGAESFEFRPSPGGDNLFIASNYTIVDVTWDGARRQRPCK